MLQSAAAHAGAHTGEEINVQYVWKTLWERSFTWKKEFHCPPSIGVKSKSMQSKQSHANIYMCIVDIKALSKLQLKLSAGRK